MEISPIGTGDGGVACSINELLVLDIENAGKGPLDFAACVPGFPGIPNFVFQLWFQRLMIEPGQGPGDLPAK
jgi:hypothetical protein